MDKIFVEAIPFLFVWYLCLDINLCMDMVVSKQWRPIGQPWWLPWRWPDASCEDMITIPSLQGWCVKIKISHTDRLPGLVSHLYHLQFVWPRIGSSVSMGLDFLSHRTTCLIMLWWGLVRWWIQYFVCDQHIKCYRGYGVQQGDQNQCLIRYYYS